MTRTRASLRAYDEGVAGIEQTQVAQCIGDTGAPPSATGAFGARGA